jgi:ABC-2 type transport system ATP-binding protein
MEQVEEICDHIVLVNLGKKILDGTVADIKQLYKENIFSIETNQIDNIRDNAIFSIVRKEGNKVFVKINGGHDGNQVLTHLINNNHHIVAYNELLPSLNEIFIKLVESTHASTRAFQNI